MNGRRWGGGAYQAVADDCGVPVRGSGMVRVESLGSPTLLGG